MSKMDRSKRSAASLWLDSLPPWDGVPSLEVSLWLDSLPPWDGVPRLEAFLGLDENSAECINDFSGAAKRTPLLLRPLRPWRSVRRFCLNLQSILPLQCNGADPRSVLMHRFVEKALELLRRVLRRFV